MPGTLALRDMVEDDLSLLAAWLVEPHVTQWWHEIPTPEQVRARYLPRLSGAVPTVMLTVLERDRPIGFAQWYRWDDYADDRDNYRIGGGELGMDYAIGEMSACNRGLGTELVGGLLDALRSVSPTGTAVSVTPEAVNFPSRRVLEKNGFTLVRTLQSAQLPGRPAEGPTAVYRRVL